MISLDKNTGDLNVDGYVFPKQTEFILKDEKYVYTSIDKKASSTDNTPCEIMASYKNGKLISIYINIEHEFIKQNYKPPADPNLNDYLTPYVNYCEMVTENLLKTITTSKLRHNWGKLSIITDPRDIFTFIQIKYY
jgi:hypothetical protein